VQSVAEVAKTFGLPINTETLGEFRYAKFKDALEIAMLYPSEEQFVAKQ
jgi:hypothetical protein